MPVAAWASKFGLRPGQRVALVEPLESDLASMRLAAPDGVRLDLGLKPDSLYDQIFYWPRQTEGLAERLRHLARMVPPQGAIWLVIPKQAHRQALDVTMTWEQMQAEALTTDLVDNKTASFSDRTYGTRFVIRRSARPGSVK